MSDPSDDFYADDYDEDDDGVCPECDGTGYVDWDGAPFVCDYCGGGEA